MHLAHVIRNESSSRLELHLLAVQESKYQWTLCHDQYLFVEEETDLPKGILFLVHLNKKLFEEETDFPGGILLLVELNENNKIIDSRPAKDWILNLVREYLVEGSTNPNINIPEELAKIEEWRRENTAESQDLTRIRLENEARREELEELLQELEQNLSREREKRQELEHNLSWEREKRQELEHNLSREKEKLKASQEDQENQ